MISIKTENICLQKAGGKEERCICLSISDTGAGMDKQVISHIFEPFYTTKESEQETGLGLSVVYGIVKSHDGWIDVISQPAQGSTFKIFLPAIKEKLINVIPNQHIKEGGHTPFGEMYPFDQFESQEEKILLVEDDPEVLSLTKKVLEKNGYLVYPCRTISEAMTIFEQENDCLDLVLCDFILLDNSGTDIVMTLKERQSFLGTLLVSGYVDDQGS